MMIDQQQKHSGKTLDRGARYLTEENLQIVGAALACLACFVSEKCNCMTFKKATSRAENLARFYLVS
jgi:hypothetical protein